ncbi:murein biosynthesis integral membrane protein MurJ [Treponema sp.]|uniref:murein biosynthesis integral membrane protein MurJ n=1 Tax=Treponema sp. TaxID=166 RepID=UPI00388E19B3
MKQKSLLAKGLSLSVLTLLSRILGLVREMTKARFLGTSAFSDAFGIAFMIPNLFRRLFAENSISVAFIPTFKNYLEDSETPEGKKDAENFVKATFTLISFLTVCFVSIGMLFTPLILRIFYSTDDSLAMNEAIILTRIMFPYLVVISIAAFFQGILNGLKIFSPSGFTPILFNTMVIALTYILSRWTANPARAMAIGVISGGTVQALFQLPFVVKNNWHVTFTTLRKAFSNPGTKKVIALVGPTIIGMAGYQINDIVSSALATRAGEGVVSSLQYSLRLQELILGICAVTIGTVILPDLTGYAKKQDWDSFNGLLAQSVKIMALIAIPITFYSLLMSENIISLVFSGGKFNADSVKMTMDVFDFHIIGLFFIAVNRIVSPAFYAQQNTKSPTIAGLINFAVNITLASLLVGNFGGRGIALALTVASAVNTAVLFAFLKKTKGIQVGKLIKSTLAYGMKIVLFSAIASVPVYFMRETAVNSFAGHARLISHGIPVASTAAVFGIVGIVLLVATKDGIVKAAAGKLRRR